MKRKWTVILLLIVLTGLSVYVLVLKNKKGTLNPESVKFSIEDTSTVDKLFIAEKSGEQVILTREKNNVWLVNGKYPARKDAIDLILLTLKNTEVKSLPAEEGKKTIIMEIAGKGKKLEVYQNGTRSKIWYIGNSTPDHKGTFMLLSDPETDEKFEDAFITWIPGFEGFLSTRFFCDENDWRNRTILSLSPNRLKWIEMDYVGMPDSSFRITLQDIHHFTIENGKHIPSLVRVDTLMIKQYLTYLSSLEVDMYLPSIGDHIVDSVRHTDFFAEFRAETMDGEIKKFRFYHKAPDPTSMGDEAKKYRYDPNYIYVSYNPMNDIALGQYFVFGKIFQSINYFTGNVKK